MKKTYESFYRDNKKFILIKNLFLMPFSVISRIIPKFNISIFGSMSGFAIADNSKYLFINTYKKNYYWITKNKKLLNIPIFDSVYPIYAYSLKGILLQLFAKNVFYTHRINDFIPALVLGGKVTALWHGVPFKKIGPITSEVIQMDEGRTRLKRYISKIGLFLMPYSNHMWCKFVICPDIKFEERYKLCFSLSNPKILIEQLPRVTYAKKNKKTRSIIYCPTYRKNRDINDVLEKVGIFSETFVSWLSQNGINFVIRPHPIDVSKVKNVKLPENIILDFSLDIYESLTQYSLLLTDYSSLYYDAEVLGLTVFFLADDIDSYNSSEEGLFEDFMEELKIKVKPNIIDLISEFENVFRIEV